MEAEAVRFFLLWIHYGVLGAWIGGIFFTTLVVEPSLDYSMVSKALSSQIQSRMFRRFNLAALGASLLLFFINYSFFRLMPEKSAGLWRIIFSILGMGIFTAYSVFSLLPRMEHLKETIPALSLESQGQREYDRLLRVYRGLQLLTGLLGLFILYGSVVIF